jgi:hypothetical protein
MRQMPNLRYTARGRPHRRQRFSARELNFGVRLAFAIFDLLATEGFPCLKLSAFGYQLSANPLL